MDSTGKKLLSIPCIQKKFKAKTNIPPQAIRKLYADKCHGAWIPLVHDNNGYWTTDKRTLLPTHQMSRKQYKEKIDDLYNSKHEWQVPQNLSGLKWYVAKRPSQDSWVVYEGPQYMNGKAKFFAIPPLDTDPQGIPKCISQNKYPKGM